MVVRTKSEGADFDVHPPSNLRKGHTVLERYVPGAAS